MGKHCSRDDPLMRPTETENRFSRRHDVSIKKLILDCAVEMRSECFNSK